jgi:hypothetical protein
MVDNTNENAKKTINENAENTTENTTGNTTENTTGNTTENTTGNTIGALDRYRQYIRDNYSDGQTITRNKRLRDYLMFKK